MEGWFSKTWSGKTNTRIRLLMNFNEDYTIHESSFEIDATFILYYSSFYSLFCPDAVFIILFFFYY